MGENSEVGTSSTAHGTRSARRLARGGAPQRTARHAADASQIAAKERELRSRKPHNSVPNNMISNKLSMLSNKLSIISNVLMKLIKPPLKKSLNEDMNKTLLGGSFNTLPHTFYHLGGFLNLLRGFS